MTLFGTWQGVDDTLPDLIAGRSNSTPVSGRVSRIPIGEGFQGHEFSFAVRMRAWDSKGAQISPQ
jgi:hypothetical protein